MKYTFIILGLLFGSKTLTAQEVWTDRSRLLPDQLRNIETAILITHSPNPVYPEINNTGKPYGKYIWKHSTSVTTHINNLEVIIAGSYIWTTKGWMANMKLSPAEFEDYFNCPNAKLKANRSFTYQENYRFGNELYGGDALWFIIAKDDKGKLYKGIGLVETEGKLKN